MTFPHLPNRLQKNRNLSSFLVTESAFLNKIKETDTQSKAVDGGGVNTANYDYPISARRPLDN